MVGVDGGLVDAEIVVSGAFWEEILVRFVDVDGVVGVVLVWMEV